MPSSTVPWRKARDVACGLGLALAGLAAMPLAPFVAMAKGKFIRLDLCMVDVDGLPREVWVERRDWPYPLFGTPDEPAPGGLYEQAILDAYRLGGRFGRWWATTCWLWRNSAYGLAWKFARPTNDYLNAVEG